METWKDSVEARAPIIATSKDKKATSKSLLEETKVSTTTLAVPKAAPFPATYEQIAKNADRGFNPAIRTQLIRVSGTEGKYRSNDIGVYYPDEKPRSLKQGLQSHFISLLSRNLFTRNNVDHYVGGDIPESYKKWTKVADADICEAGK